MGPDGALIDQLTQNDATDIQPDWSPDGTSIAFISDADGFNDVWVINPDGSSGQPHQRRGVRRATGLATATAERLTSTALPHQKPTNTPRRKHRSELSAARERA